MSTETRTARGFTLIELLIVMAIIGILAGILIPVYQNSVSKANEAAAVAALNTIKVAQAKYVIDKGNYGTFSQLVDAGYLDKRFKVESPHIRGYIFMLTMIDAPQKAAASFKLNVNPESAEGIGATGRYFYYSEPDVPILFSDKGPAGPEDPVL
jgi:prepilin-type N-terminal cleavage/methylation domain-containing protein